MIKVKLEDGFKCANEEYGVHVAECIDGWSLNIKKGEALVLLIHIKREKEGYGLTIEKTNPILNVLGFYTEKPIYWGWDNESYDEFLSRYEYDFSREDWKNSGLIKWSIVLCGDSFYIDEGTDFFRHGMRYFKDNSVVSRICEYLTENREKALNEIWGNDK